MEQFPFREVEGLKVRIDENASPADYVELYLTDRVMELIVRETNHYAESFMLENPGQANNSYIGKWTPVDVTEINKNFGLLFLMGIVKKPDIEMYWTTAELLSTPIFSKVMTCDRFRIILKFLHFNDNDDPDYDPNSDERDRLHKIRPSLI